MTVPLRFDQLNPARQNIIRRNLRTLQSKGASDAEVESYLRDDEGLSPAEQAPAKPVLSGAEKASGTLLEVAQGGLGNFADELAGAAHAVVHPFSDTPFAERYQEGKEGARAILSRYRQANPKTALALNLAGGIAPAVTPGIRELGPAAGGAVYGAVAGAGEAEGDLSDRLVGAGIGAGLGAGAGVATEKLVLPAAAAVIRKAAPWVRRVGASEAAQALKNFVAEHPPGMTTRDVSGASLPPNATRATTPSIVESFAPPTAKERAISVILKAAKADKRTPEVMLSEATATPTSQPLTLHELGDQNVMGVSRGARAVGSSEAKREIPNALFERAKGEHGRARAALESAAGTEAGDTELVTQALVERTKANAKPAYEKAYAGPAIKDQEAVDILRDPLAPSMYETASRLAARDQVTLPPLEDVLTGKAGLPVRGFDYFKQGMDEVIESRAGSSGAIGRREARQLRTRLNKSLAKVDELNPDYKAARAQFAGDKEMEDAAEAGRDFLKTDDRQIGRQIADYTPGEREVYTKTALDAITREIRATGDTHDVYTRIFGNDLKRSALKALVGDEAFQGLQQEMEALARRGQSLRFVTGGSNTVDKLGEQMDLEAPGIPTALFQFAKGNPGQAAKTLGTSVLANRLRGITSETASELSPMFTAGAQGTPESREALMGVLQALRDAADRNVAKAATRTRVRPFVRPLSAQAGGAVVPRNERR